MTYEWDENKRELNKIKHGLDFALVEFVFNDPKKLDIVDNRKDYGEARRCVIGKIGNRIFFVVYTVRNESIRIISFRTAKEKERRKYYGNS